MNYQLDQQIGYKLRLATQRHLEIFSTHIPQFTPPQFSVMVRLFEHKSVSQNHLGRMIATDAATIKGIVERLAKRGLVTTVPDLKDRRRINVMLTETGEAEIAPLLQVANNVTQQTVAPLDDKEQLTLLRLLDKISQPVNSTSQGF